MSLSKLLARFANPVERESWDTLIGDNPGGTRYQNTLAFATVKGQFGWRVKQVVFETAAGSAHSYAQILARKVPLLGTLWYLPCGPAAVTTAELAAHTAALRELAKQQRRVFAIVANPPLLEDDVTEVELKNLGYQRVDPVQGDTNTAIVDLTPELSEIFANFKGTCRNHLRRAERDGVTVTSPENTAATHAHMHRLMRLVGGGSAVLFLRAQNHSKLLWNEFSRRDQGRFYSAADGEGEPAVMSYMIRVNETAFYKDGGSDRPRTSPGMSNLVIWQMIVDAKEAGATRLDLCGIAPRWANSTAEHPSYGLGKFKLAFAGKRTDYIGALELPLRPAPHRLWRRFGARLAAKLYRRRYGDITMY